MDNYIEFKNLEMSFYTKSQKISIFNNLNLSFESGTFIAIVGPSGMGKSTMLNLISGFIKPNKGIVLVDGNDIVKMSDKDTCEYRNKKIGYIFQSFNLIPQFSVKENIAVPLILSNYTKPQIDDKVDALLESVGMTKRKFEYPNTLSGGEQQRVAFARAIANNTDIILADEPTGNLDTKNGERLIDMLWELCIKGKTIISVTHDERLRERATKIINIEDITFSDLE